MKLTYNLMMVQWNPVNVTDYYIISISPLINDNESEFTLMTTNTTIQLPLQHNQDYNISVMASNCVGNSTPAEISMRVGKALAIACYYYANHNKIKIRILYIFNS